MLKKVISAAFLFASLALVSSAVVVNAAPNAERATASGQIRSCEARFTNVQTRSQNMVRHANTLMNRIGAIETKVEDFYQDRVVASGQEVENYNDLQAQIQAKQRVVEMKLEEAQKTASDFSCDNDPKGQVRNFGNDIKEVTTALNEYKKSVRDLLVAVHRVSLGMEEQ